MGQEWHTNCAAHRFYKAKLPVGCCCCCCVLQSITKDASGQVTGATAELNLAGDFKKTKLKLTWLADVPDLVPLTLTEFDYLITKKKVRSFNQ